MNKNLLNKILSFTSLSALILALFITFCNPVSISLSNANLAVQPAQAVPAETLGDRGSSHLPDIGFSLPQDTWFLVLICILAFISLASIITLVVIKIKINKKIVEEQEKIMQEQKQEGVKGSSLKEVVAKNLENDKKELEKIDNPKH